MLNRAEDRADGLLRGEMVENILTPDSRCFVALLGFVEIRLFEKGLFGLLSPINSIVILGFVVWEWGVPGLFSIEDRVKLMTAVEGDGGGGVERRAFVFVFVFVFVLEYLFEETIGVIGTIGIEVGNRSSLELRREISDLGERRSMGIIGILLSSYSFPIVFSLSIFL